MKTLFIPTLGMTYCESMNVGGKSNGCKMSSLHLQTMIKIRTPDRHVCVNEASSCYWILFLHVSWLGIRLCSLFVLTSRLIIS